MAFRQLAVISFGVGVMIGGCLTCYWLGSRVSMQIQCLLRQIDSLQQQITRLNELIRSSREQNENKLELEKDKLETKECLNSSLDDDDIFEEAYDGPMPWLSSFNPAIYSTGDIHSTSSGGTDDELFRRVDELFDGDEVCQEEAYELLLRQPSHVKQSADYMWRLTKSTYLHSQTYASKDKQVQKDLLYESVQLAEQALSLDDKCAEAHKWYAITLGSTNDYESASIKIRNGYTFKKHIERAIELKPSDPTGHYLLGRWCYGVYMLSWMERKMASTLFATPPTSTIEESLSHFMQADRLSSKNWKENMLFIGKCWIEKKNYLEATKWLIRAREVPTISSTDQSNQLEIEALLEKYSKYAYIPSCSHSTN